MFVNDWNTQICQLFLIILHQTKHIHVHAEKGGKNSKFIGNIIGFE